MTKKYNYDFFKTHTPTPIGKKSEYSVLIPIVTIDENDYLLYHVRASSLKRQPGEIAFPGGRKEINEDFVTTAIRETCEELGITEDKIDLIGAMDYVVASSGHIVMPFVGKLKIDSLDELDINKSEVDSVFLIAIEDLIKAPIESYYLDLFPTIPKDFPLHKIQNGQNYEWNFGPFPVHFYEFDDKIIWGLTAKITKVFLKYL